ncbi:hypothetical protein ON010_g1695 [Phytophthora cinnamomi]|nr:hypothetical protein ON010_g1695 [Phytophthora cinnamomi]
MRVRDAAGVDASQEPIYELAPINPLPTIDLSKSVGAELLPVHIDALIFYGMERFKKSLMLASLTSLCMNVAVIVVKESIGQWLSLTSLVLGTPLVAGSICTLRYDIIRLVLRTFEFWSFFIILSLTTLMYTAFVGDLRIPRVLLDWFACLEVVFLDCQVHDLREHVIGVIVAIAPISMMLIWSMLGRIYGGTSFTILAYENHNSHFNLSALDVMGNGLVTLVLLFIKIGYRKREALRSDFNTVRVDCAIIRVGLKMEMISVKKPRSRRQSHDDGIGRSALRTAPTQTISATPPPACPRIIQKFGFVKVNQTFASNQIVFPIRASAGVRIPALRRSAESVNATLRSEIVAQAKYAANLKRMLKRRYSEEMLELVPIVNRGRTVEHKASGDNQRIHDNLLEGTDDIYASVDALFEKKGMDQVPCPGTTKQTYTSTVNGVFLELMSKNQVPFDLRSTTRAVWKSFQGQKMRDGDHVQTKVCVQDVKLTDSVITSYMSYTCNAAGHSSYVQERRVARKYVEADRSVFVSRSLTDPTSRSAGFLGLLFQESLVVVVRRGQPLASGQKTSVIECYLWVTRCDDGKEEAVQFRKPKFTDLAVSGWDSKLSLLSQRIENILFDEPIGSM